MALPNLPAEKVAKILKDPLDSMFICVLLASLEAAVRRTMGRPPPYPGRPGGVFMHPREQKSANSPVGGASSNVVAKPLLQRYIKSPISHIKLYEVMLLGIGFSFLMSAFDIDDTPQDYSWQFIQMDPFIQSLLLAPGQMVSAHDGYRVKRYTVSSMYVTEMGVLKYVVTPVDAGALYSRHLPMDLLFAPV